MKFDGPYCPVPQKCPPEYTHVVYPTAWAVLLDKGVMRMASDTELEELGESWSRVWWCAQLKLGVV